MNAIRSKSSLSLHSFVCDSERNAVEVVRCLVARRRAQRLGRRETADRHQEESGELREEIEERRSSSHALHCSSSLSSSGGVLSTSRIVLGNIEIEREEIRFQPRPRRTVRFHHWLRTSDQRGKSLLFSSLLLSLNRLSFVRFF